MPDNEFETFKQRFLQIHQIEKIHSQQPEEILDKAIQFCLNWKKNITKTSNSMAVDILKIPEQMRRIQKSEQTLEEISRSNASVSQDLASSSEQLEANLAMLLENTKMAQQLTEQTSQNANTIQTNLEHLVQKTSQLSQDSEELKNNNKKISKEIEIINQLSQSIKKSFESINEVSDTTKIIAINALIESAHAGEAGKGFSVVANKVSELSVKTKEIVTQVGENFTNLIEKLLEWKELLDNQNRNIHQNIDSQAAILKMIHENGQSISSSREDFLQMEKIYEDFFNSLQEIKQGSQILTRSSIQLSESTVKIQDESISLQTQVATVNQSIEEMVKEVTNQNAYWLYEFIQERKQDHIQWVQDLKHAIEQMDSQQIPELNHTKCKLGLWYYSASIENAEQRQIHESMEPPHIALHQVGHKITRLIEKGDTHAINQELAELEGIFSRTLQCFERYAAFLQSRMN